MRRVDAELSSPWQIVLIGGGAVALKYKGSHATTDLDLWSVASADSSERDFWDAVDRATAGSRVHVPIQKAPIAEPPYSFEERLLKVPIAGLTKLEVLVPDAHDLVLMKVARGEAHDLDAIEDIHRAVSLDLETLVARYRETVPQVVGSKEMHRLNFLAAVGRLFGERAAERVDTQTR
ncbi:MAG: hypothetical protein IPJ65_28625 [Archangiaceae bacterium]|nr:hypothetical protein [Archangiaceae bacterium]